jgi:LytS/YehU family sensor histidine kinase
LFFKNRRPAYFLSVGIIIAIFTMVIYYIPNPRGENFRPDRGGESRLLEPSPPPPGEKLHTVPPPGNRPGFMPPPEAQRRGPIPPFANFIIFAVLLVGFDTGLRLSFKLFETERAREKLEKEHIGTKLAFLRNQVSPHFFMNTLNNIHSQIDEDREEAKESIIRLSKLMRHLLYDSESDQIALQKEIDFIQNYVDLMKLRYSEKVSIILEIPEEIPEKNIPPLLFTSFVENAFRHGISYRKESTIHIRFSVGPEKLIFRISNSIPETTSGEKSSGGIGIENARDRLDLIFGEDYTLNILETAEKFDVHLIIPLC